MPRERSGRLFPPAAVLLSVAMGLSVALFGCSPSYDGSPDLAGSAASNGAAGDGAAEREREVTLQTVDKAGFDKVIDGHKGQVVFVDFWGTWCISCLERFPHTVELHNKYHNDGLRVVTVAFEFDPVVNEEDALQKLKELNATFDNLLSDEPLEDAVNTYDISGGGLPEIWLFGRDGKLLRKFTNEDPNNPIDDAEVDKAVRAALGLDKTGEESE